MSPLFGRGEDGGRQRLHGHSRSACLLLAITIQSISGIIPLPCLEHYEFHTAAGQRAFYLMNLPGSARIQRLCCRCNALLTS